MDVEQSFKDKVAHSIFGKQITIRKAVAGATKSVAGVAKAVEPTVVRAVKSVAKGVRAVSKKIVPRRKI